MLPTFPVDAAPSEDSDDDDEVVVNAWQFLEEILAARGDAPGALVNDAVFVRFRAASAARSSKDLGVGESVGAEAPKGLPRTWVIRYSLPQSASFSVSVLGISNAASFAVEWCTRMVFFYAIWLAQDDHIFVSSAVDKQSYVPGVEWSELVATFAPGTNTFERAHSINLLLPQQPL